MPALFDQVPPPPCPERFNLAAHALSKAAAHPERIALIIAGPAAAERWSYARLSDAVRATGAGLLAQGLAPGDRVLLRLGNQNDFPIAFLGAIAVGLVPVPTSSQLTTPEINRIAAEIKPRLVLEAPGNALPDPQGARVLGLDALRTLRSGPACAFHPAAPDDLAYLVYTSGSSGHPRAVMHAHRALWARRMMHTGWYGLEPDDRMMHAGAFNWTYTLGTGLLDPWTVGATAIIPDASVTPDQLGLLLERHGATIFAAAPGVYRQILRNPLPELPHLRHALSAGEKLPETTRAAWQAATGRPVFEALGMSECSTFISASPARPAPSGASGFAQHGRRVAVLGPDFAPVACDAPGQLAVSRRDPGLFLGYLDQPDETASRFAGEWFLTGDMVAMASDGAITYLGRDDDMLNAGGYRVSPLEVERAMEAHPEIIEAAAVELAIKPATTVIALCYTGTKVPEADLVVHAASALARYKQPRLFVWHEALPRGPNNKINRRALREALAAGDTLSR